MWKKYLLNKFNIDLLSQLNESLYLICLSYINIPNSIQNIIATRNSHVALNWIKFLLYKSFII